MRERDAKTLCKCGEPMKRQTQPPPMSAREFWSLADETEPPVPPPAPAPAPDAPAMPDSVWLLWAESQFWVFTDREQCAEEDQHRLVRYDAV